MAPWCSCYHYCITSFNKVWTLVLRRFKSCSRGVGDSWWWESLKMVPAGNEAKGFSSVNHTTKTIHSFIHSSVLLLVYLYFCTFCILPVVLHLCTPPLFLKDHNGKKVTHLSCFTHAIAPYVKNFYHSLILTSLYLRTFE